MKPEFEVLTGPPNAEAAAVILAAAVHYQASKQGVAPSVVLVDAYRRRGVTTDNDPHLQPLLDAVDRLP